MEDRRQSQGDSPQTSDDQRWEPGRTHTGSLCGAIRLAIPAAAATSRTRCPFDKSSQFYVDIQLESQPLSLTGPCFLLKRYWHSSSYQKGSVNNFVGIFTCKQSFAFASNHVTQVTAGSQQRTFETFPLQKTDKQMFALNTGLVHFNFSRQSYFQPRRQSNNEKGWHSNFEEKSH